jgi:hypothetical protein
MKDEKESIFHITWHTQKTPTAITTGKNYKAYTMEEALKKFRNEYPNINPLYIIKNK